MQATGIFFEQTMGMDPINYILYFESFSLRESVKKAFNKQLPSSLVYELQSEDRLLAGATSGYFDFAIFAVDRFNKTHQKILKNLFLFSKNLPIVVIANEYEDGLQNFKPRKEQQIYLLYTNDIEDLPGISLRIFKDNTYYQRQYERKKSSLNLELGFDDKNKTGIQIKNLSDAGVQFVSRLDLEKNECPYLFHKTLKGHNITVPIQILWKQKQSDGRYKYGAKYLSLN